MVNLMEEYVERFFTLFRIIEVTGFCRFIIRNGKIVERNTISMVYNVFVVILADAGAFTILWTANSSEQTLTVIEFGAVVHFSIFANMLLVHITFGDKFRGPDFIDNCIKLDNFLGANETEFMRRVAFNLFKIFVVIVGFTQVGVVAYMYYVFHVSIAIHIVGSTYFFWIFFAYDDFCFFLYAYFFLTTRARYLNVALVKVTRMKLDYVPRDVVLHVLLWKDEYNDRITYHTRAQHRDFSIAFKMLFHQLRHVERIYRFPIMLGVTTIIMGSFVTVQSFVMYIEASAATLRASVITFWVIASWFYMFGVSIVTDTFYRQIEQTKLICAYIQLKPTSSPEMLKLTKDVIATLEVRDARASLYSVFYFDTGLMLRLAASTFVYITVQLQLAFPNLQDGRKDNVTKPAFELTPDLVKEFLFFVFYFDTRLMLRLVASTFVYITVQLQLAFPNLQDGRKDNVTKPAFELIPNLVKEFLFWY